MGIGQAMNKTDKTDSNQRTADSSPVAFVRGFEHVKRNV